MYLDRQYKLCAQRTAAYYLTVFNKYPKIINGIDMTAYIQFNEFLYAFYKLLLNEPYNLGLEEYEDITLKKYEYYSNNKNFKKAFDSVCKVVNDFLKFLYRAGQTGTLSGNSLTISDRVYLEFINNKKRSKQKLINGMTLQGFSIQEQNNSVILSNSKYPEMPVALKKFACICDKNKHGLGFLCFYRSDFKAFDISYRPSAEFLLTKLIGYHRQYIYIYKIHNYMKDNGYDVSLKIDQDFIWNFNYTNTNIKKTPLVELTFDMRYEIPVYMTLKFISTYRLMTVLKNQSLSLKEDFFNIVSICKGKDCKRICKQKGGLRPWRFVVGDKQKTVCWQLKKKYYTWNDNVYKRIIEYLKLQQKTAEIVAQKA